MSDRTTKTMEKYDALVRKPRARHQINALLEHDPLMQQKMLKGYSGEQLDFLRAVLRDDQAPRAALLRLAEAERGWRADKEAQDE